MFLSSLVFPTHEALRTPDLLAKRKLKEILVFEHKTKQIKNKNVNVICNSMIFPPGLPIFFQVHNDLFLCN